MGPLSLRLGPVLILLLALGAALRPTLPAAGAAWGDAPLFPPGADHDPTVPTTEAVLGYSLGERMTDFAAMQAYVQALSRDATRVVQRAYGKTHEGRPLRYLILSHPDNMARLEEIRAASVRLSDPRGLTRKAAQEIIRSNPVVVWLAYGVHGDEHSSTEAALAAAYHLAATRDEATLRMMRDVVVIIDPAQNPDGRERFITYQRQVTGPEPRVDPHSVEHDQPWPGGRYNHDLFDLNRDWFFRTQPETRGKVAAYLEWMPQVHVDFHEMGSDATYYFAPPAEPINRNIPELTRKWWGIFGNANASAFDRAGFDYYTGESFDEYYPGYGDSWPTLQGAVGMTYEQASARGLSIERKDGGILTLKEATRHHLTASLATVGAAAAHRQALLEDFHAFRSDAIASGGAGPIRAYIIPPSVPAAAARLAALLAEQGVEVRRAEEEFASRTRAYDGSEARSRRFPDGTYIVDLAQPAGRLAAALMEMDPLLDERFIAEELERRRLKADSGIYDVTSWTLPLVTGAEAYWTAEPVRARASRAPAGSLRTAGRVIALHSAGETATGGKAYAYLLKYDSNAAAMALVDLLNLAEPARAGLRVQAAGKPFRVGAESFPAGSVILKAGGNRAAAREIVRKQAEIFGLTFYEVASGLTDSGPDLGSGSVVTLRPPRVAVAWGEPVAPTSAGAIGYLFERVYGMPFAPVRTRTLTEADLSRYNVIILPDAMGSPGYAEHLGSEGIRKLKAWVEGGGTLVTIRRAASFAAGKEAGLTTARRLYKPLTEGATAPEDPNELKAGEGPDQESEPPDRVPGAILRVAIEPSRYLGFGYGREGAVMVDSNLAFSPSRKGRNVVTFASKERLRLAGFAWQESLDLLAGTAYLIEEPRGRGRVVLFADDPNFRGYWEALNRMFLNSVVFAPSFGEGD